MKTFDSRFTPREIFARMQGAWLEPRTGSMWQENTGVTPTTTGGQTIGLLLDQSQGAVQGPELVTNGDFSNGTTGWTLGAWDGSPPTPTVSNGVINLPRPDISNISRISQSINCEVGKSYLISLTSLALNIKLRVGSAVGLFEQLDVRIPSGITRTFVFTAGFTSQFITVWSDENWTAQVDTISVRNIAGNHASQATAANRPLFGARRNLLVQTEDFSNAVWSAVYGSGSITANDGIAPDGTLTADRITFTGRAITQQNIPGVFGLTYTFSIWLKAASASPGMTPIYIYQDNYGVVATLSVIPPASWQRYEVTVTHTVADTTLQVGINIGTFDAYVWGAQFEINSVATDYQRVTTATDYDAGRFPAIRHADSTDVLTATLPAINVRRNLLTYSEQFDTGAWNKSFSVVYRSVLSPNKISPGYKYVANNGAEPNVNVLSEGTTGISPLTAYTYSAYLKSAELTAMKFLFAAFTGTPPAGFISQTVSDVDLSTGVVSNVSSGEFTNVSLTTRKEGDGWYRLIITATTPLGTAGVQGRITTTSVGDGSSGFYVSGAQLELGSVATDYQKITDWTSEAYSSSGSTYFATSAGMSSIHNQSIGTTYNLPAPQTDVYGVVVVPNRLPPITEQKLALYMQQLAGVQDGNFFWQEDYGPELVTNGDFSSGSVDGVDAHGGSLSVVDGKLKALSPTGVGFSATINVTTTVNTTYRVSWYMEKGFSNYARFYVGTAYGSANLILPVDTTSSGTFSAVFKAIGTVAVLHMQPAGVFEAGSYSYFDNISVRELKDGMVGQLLADDNDTILLAQ